MKYSNYDNINNKLGIELFIGNKMFQEENQPNEIHERWAAIQSDNHWNLHQRVSP